jgi:hypothetical protein
MRRSRRREEEAAAAPRARRSGLVVRRLGDETVVYDVERHRAHSLGPLVARIWRACDGKRSPHEIAAAVATGRGGRPGSDAVAVALRRLDRARLFEGRFVAPAMSDGRRTALRHIAGLSALALVTIATPTPLQAASCTPAAICTSLPNKSCTGLPCCEFPTRTCRKPAGGPSCLCT